MLNILEQTCEQTITTIYFSLCHRVIYCVLIDHDSPSCAWSGAMCDAHLAASSGKKQFFPGPPNLATVLSSECVSVGWHESDIAWWFHSALVALGSATGWSGYLALFIPAFIFVTSSEYLGRMAPKTSIDTWDLCCFACAYTTGSRHFTLHFTGLCSFYVGPFWSAALCGGWREHVAITSPCFTRSGSCRRRFCRFESGDSLEFLGAWLCFLQWFPKMFCSWCFWKTCELKFSI